MSKPPFHILTTGWPIEVIRRLADPIESRTGFRFSHVLDPAVDRESLPKGSEGHFHVVRDDVRMAMPESDVQRLASLEQPGVRTIRNMILGDAIVRTLDDSDALRWATFLATRYEELFTRIAPSMILGAFDGFHGGIAFAVAKKLGIPWFCLNFTTIPPGMAGFCSAMSPDTSRSFLPWNPDELRGLAEKTVGDFESRKLVVPAHLSANSIALILRRLPNHIRVFYRTVRRSLRRRTDKYTHFSARRLARQYLRKRVNAFLLPEKEFVKTPPSAPYVFYGLQLQPETAIDVWSPFFADQFSVIEHIARSTPPTHEVLIKLHKSDADNYSPRQLARLQKLPGVRIVAPYAASRDFIEHASLVLAIQGNIALEAALLGKPVLVFGDSKFIDLPSVTKVKRVTDLPGQIRAKLVEPPSAHEAIVRGMMTYLSGFAPGCYNNWQAAPSDAEIAALAEHFRALRNFVEQQQAAPATAAVQLT